MSLLDFIQPSHPTRPSHLSTSRIPYHLAPCAKAIGVLLLILGNTTAWASIDTEKKEPERSAQAQEMIQHLGYLKQDRENQLNLHPDQRQKGKIEYLEGQIRQQYEQLQNMHLFEYNVWDLMTEAEVQKSLVGTQKALEETQEDLAQLRRELELEQEVLAQKRKQQDQVGQKDTSLVTTTDKPKSVPKKKTKQETKPQPKPESIIELNPQIGIYIANQIAAQKMFITDDLQHRQRETLYIDPLTGERKTTNMWLNTSSTASRFNAGHKQLNTKSSRYAIQLGGPLIKWSYGENDQGLLGITTGLGRATNNSYSASSNNQVHGSVEGYNLGLYSIWFADSDTRLGTYVDLLTQCSFFKNHIRTPGVRDVTHYQSYVFTTALETGYKIQLLEKEQARFFVQPNAKVSWQLSSGLQHDEVAREPVTIEKSDSVVTKLGVRTALEFDIATLSTKNIQISPSFEANWIHNNGNKGTWLSQTRVTPQGNRDIAELKLGIESQISHNLQLWTNLGQQFGRQKYSETQATIGGNYHF